MNFKQLQAFRMVVKLGTVTKASHFLHMQQPSVSRMVSDLENTLGFALFTRSKGRLLLTQSGRLFYEQVEHHFDSLNSLSHQAQSIRANMTESLRIVAAPTLSHALVTDALAVFYKQNPSYTMHMMTHSSERIMELMQQQAFDLAFCLTPNTYYDLNMDLIGSLQACCVIRKDHPLAQKQVIEMTDLSAANIILPDPRYTYSVPLEKKLQQVEGTCKVIATAMLSSVACRMVKNGMGIAITEPMSSMDDIPDTDTSNVVIRPLMANISFSYWAIYNPSLADGTVIQNFVTYIKTRFNHHFKDFEVK